MRQLLFTTGWWPKRAEKKPGLQPKRCHVHERPHHQLCSVMEEEVLITEDGVHSPKTNNKPGQGREASEVGWGAFRVKVLDFCVGGYCWLKETVQQEYSPQWGRQIPVNVGPSSARNWWLSSSWVRRFRDWRELLILESCRDLRNHVSSLEPVRLFD